MDIPHPGCPVRSATVVDEEAGGTEDEKYGDERKGTRADWARHPGDNRDKEVDEVGHHVGEEARAEAVPGPTGPIVRHGEPLDKDDADERGVESLELPSVELEANSVEGEEEDGGEEEEAASGADVPTAADGGFGRVRG